MIILKTCHSLAILFIHYMQKNNIIDLEPLYYPQEISQDEIYKKLLVLNTVNRCLVKINNYSFHEFILVITKKNKYIIQVNMYNTELYNISIIKFNDDLSELKNGDKEFYERLKLIEKDDKRFNDKINLVFHGFVSYKIGV